MTRYAAWTVIGAAVVTACNASRGGVEVRDAAVRVAPAGATTAAAYATLRNRGDAVDTLLGISSDVGGALQLHEYSIDAGLATMRPIGIVALPVDGTVRLVPGGLHAMLGTAVTPGRIVRLTFRFATAPSVSIAVPVTAITGEE